MFPWAIVLFICAVIAGVLGYTGIAAPFAGIAQVLCIIFFILFLAAVLIGFIGRRKAK